MTDIFLILFLTTITQTPATSVLTIEDFFQLKTMHETLQAKQKEAEEEFQKKLRLTQKEKETLAAQLVEEKKRAEEVEESLIVSDAEIERIHEDLKIKEVMLKDREQLLANLNDKIMEKEVLWEKMETSYKEKLEDQKESLEAHQMRAQELQLEAQKAQQLANQMQQEADQAYEIAKQAKAVKENAILLKDEALKEKQEAQLSAQKALEERKKAEEEKERALKTAEQARKLKEQVEKKAEKLAVTIKEITQEGKKAYQNNIFPQMQEVTVIFERIIPDVNNVKGVVISYDRELVLVPVQINGQVLGIFSSRQIGFKKNSDQAPRNLVITYQGEKITRYWLNKKDNLIAIELPGFSGEASKPYPADTDIDQLMPTLLAVRNNGDKSLGDFIRDISDEYFIVNRDYLQPNDAGGLKYEVKGIRGTGVHGERIIRGDQLVDLNGRLIGVAAEANRMIRIESIKGWEQQAL